MPKYIQLNLMDESVCMICTEEYSVNKRPQILFPCAHNICDFCLVNMNSAFCPFCRSNIITFTYNRSLLNSIMYNKFNDNLAKKMLKS